MENIKIKDKNFDKEDVFSIFDFLLSLNITDFEIEIEKNKKFLDFKHDGKKLIQYTIEDDLFFEKFKIIYQKLNKEQIYEVFHQDNILTLAIITQNFDIINFLIKEKFDLNHYQNNIHMFTPLRHAFYRRNDFLACLLLDNGLDLNTKVIFKNFSGQIENQDFLIRSIFCNRRKFAYDFYLKNQHYLKKYNFEEKEMLFTQIEIQKQHYKQTNNQESLKKLTELDILLKKELMDREIKKSKLSKSIKV